MEITNIKKVLIGSSIAVLTSVSSLSMCVSYAQGSNKTFTLEEIIVTARKRSESLQSVPVAVTALTGKSLEQQNITSAVDIARNVPNLVSTPGIAGSANDANFFIRGIGQADSSILLDPGVALYIDKVYYGRTTGASLDLLDIDWVEILRGPQGTLFGRNTIGGLVAIHTKLPDLEAASGNIKILGGSRNNRQVKIGGNIPLIEDKLAVRMNGFYADQDGWVKRVQTGDTLGDNRRLAGNFSLLFKPTEDFTAILRATVSDSDGTVLGKGIPSEGLAVAVNPFGIVLPDFDAFRTDEFYKAYRSNAGISKVNSHSFGLEMTWEASDNLSIKSITGLNRFNQFVTPDFDSSPFPTYDQNVFQNSKQFTQEIQFTGSMMEDKLGYVVGLYYLDEKVSSRTFTCFGGSLVPIAPADEKVIITGPGDIDCLSQDLDVDLDVKSYAAFGEVSYQFTNDISLTLGMRYSEEEKNVLYNLIIDNSGFFSPFFPPFPIPAIDNESNSQKWTSFTPKMVLDWQATETSYYYLSYAEGFRSGGFQNRPTGGATVVKPFKPEKSRSYEAGTKLEFLNKRLRVNASAFFVKYEEVQLVAFEGPFSIVLNGGEAEFKGFELDIVALLGEGWSVNFSAGYLDAKYTKLAAGLPFILDSKLPSTPEWTLNGGIQYTGSIGSDLVVTPRLSANYVGDQFYSVTNAPGDFQEGYALVDFTIDLSNEGAQWKISAFVNNLTGKKYIAASGDTRQPSLGVGIVFPGRPREFGVSFSYSFN